MVNKRKVINLLMIGLSTCLSVLILDVFFWVFNWLMEKKFDSLGWLRMPLDFSNYSDCEIRMDYVVHSLSIFIYLAVIPLIAGILYYGFFKKNKTNTTP